MSTEQTARQSVVAIGDDEFIMGFRLAGLQSIHYRAEEDMMTLLRDQSIGIIITSKETFDSLSDNRKYDALKSIRPVVVVVSSEPQEELRKMIIRSIGVDLLKE